MRDHMVVEQGNLVHSNVSRHSGHHVTVHRIDTLGKLGVTISGSIIGTTHVSIGTQFVRQLPSV